MAPRAKKRTASHPREARAPEVVPMAPFTVNPHRLDPYKAFKFRVKWDGRYVAGVSRIGALRRTTEVVEHREGGDPNAVHKSPGLTRYEPLVLERGLTHDTAFEAWADKVHHPRRGPGTEVSLADFRKDVAIDLFNEAGQKVLSYKLYRCWVSSYQALPDLDAAGNVVALERIILEYESWERDADVGEPAEPSV